MRLRPMLMASLLALIPVTAGGQVQRQANPHPMPAKPPAGLQPADGYQLYRGLLGKMCPDRHLEMLSPGELDDLIEVNFHDRLAPALQTKLETADAEEKHACDHLTMGLACFDIAYIRAMNDVNLLARFTRMVCDTGIVCRAPAECGRQ
ncbi:MAG TPA: hypothetical protein VN718_02770 [Rhizomicrobium sp.]|nr:hypothetical protein [Rhizomicrobium sp.]